MPSVDDKIRRALTLLFQTTNKELFTTQIVKLIYLADFLYCRQYGHTITGLNYIWDNYGPNAVDNLIVKIAQSFCNVKNVMTIYGDTARLFSLRESEQHQLDQEVEMLFTEIVRHYGNWSTEKLTWISKQTEPFNGIEQFDKLCLVKSGEFDDAKSFASGQDGKGLARAAEAVQRIKQGTEKPISLLELAKKDNITIP